MLISLCSGKYPMGFIYYLVFLHFEGKKFHITADEIQQSRFVRDFPPSLENKCSVNKHCIFVYSVYIVS